MNVDRLETVFSTVWFAVVWSMTGDTRWDVIYKPLDTELEIGCTPPDPCFSVTLTAWN